MPRVLKRLPSISHRTMADALSRLRWEGRKPRQGWPTDMDLDAMVRERALWRAKDGGGGMCHRVARAVDSRFGWPMVTEGTYLSRDDEVICGSGHCWNVLPDGSVLDATADQWCEGHDVRIVRPNEPDYLRYRVGFDHAFNSDIPNRRWPELDSCPWNGKSDAWLDGDAGVARGHGWWSADPEAVRVKWERYMFLYVAHERSLTMPDIGSGDIRSPVTRLNALAARMRDIVGSLPDDWDFGGIEGVDPMDLTIEGSDAVRDLAANWNRDMPYGGYSLDVTGIGMAKHCMKAYQKWILDNPVTANLPLSTEPVMKL